MLDLGTPKTYGALALAPEAKEWHLTDCPPHVAMKVKNVFPRIRKTDTGLFRFRNDPETCLELQWFMQRYPLAMAPAERQRLAASVTTYKLTLQEAERIFAPTWQPGEVPTSFKEGLAPYPMQVQAADLAVSLGRLLIMDDLGLGKTISAITAIIKSGTGPAAVVVQTHLPKQWLREYIMRFTNLVGYMIEKTTPYELPPADIYLFKYTQLAGWSDVFATGAFPVVVWDEIQELRGGRGTQKGLAADIMAEQAKLKIGLSATPIFNLGSEMFNIMEFIEPGCLGTREEFYREWCGAADARGNAIVKDPDALGLYLEERKLVIRREKLGNRVNKIVVDVPFEDEEAEKHVNLARTLALRTLNGSFTERGQAARELDMMLRQITGIAKARHVAAYARMLLKAGKPVLLGLWHREVYRIISRELAEFKPLMYTGSETQKEKDRAKEAFVTGESNLMLLSLRSGAGIDGLQKRCSTLIIGELDWSPKVHDQLTGRLDRPGQIEDLVDVIYMVADGGSDPAIVELLGIKASQSHGIVNPGQAPKPTYSDESRMKVLARRYLEQIDGAAAAAA